MSEYRTPEEDTIGGHGEDEPAEEAGPDPESGEKPEPDHSRAPADADTARSARDRGVWSRPDRAIEQRRPAMGETARIAREFTEAFNAHDEGRVRASYAEKVSFWAPGSEGVEGADAATEYAMTYIRAFPDVRLTTTNEIEAGDWIALEFEYDGTHTGPLAAPDGSEIPPTNRRATGKGVDVLRIEAGKVIEEHLYFDQLEFMAQLGLVPEQATA